MVFSSTVFLFAYLPITLLIYYISPLKLRNLALLLVSLIFYGWGEPVYILIMLLSIMIDYTHGMLVEKYRARNTLARTFVVSSIFFNLLLLGFFKYYDFFAANLSLIPGINLPTLGLPLPIGISFYTFQTMSYTIDVYRNDAPVQRNIIKFGTFVTLFPQLIAGPIIRYKDIAEQLNSREETLRRFGSGAARFTAGLCKKVLLANNIGMLWDSSKAMPQGELTVLGAYLGILAFAFQIYFDFSGYSDMAIGLGRMFGFEFIENFNYPYISKSITEFWRRWHISLGTWFREYVYIPLGGNRVSTFKTYRNIFIVWLITGFWHGASWNFAIWGGYFAILLMLEKAFMLKLLKRAPALLSRLWAMSLVFFGWVLFAIESLPEMLGYLKIMLGINGNLFLDGNFLYDLRSFLPALVILVLASTPLGAQLYRRVPARVRSALTPVLMLCGLALSTAFLVNSTYNPFLYFRF